jgi:glutathione S-transferase
MGDNCRRIFGSRCIVALTLYFHPLASFCHKVLIALYENATPFERHIVDLGNDASRSEYYALWPVGKMPLLRDSGRDCTIPETTIILEYLDRHYPGPRPLLPADETARLDARLWDRFYDLYVHQQMQKVVLDRLWRDEEKDPRGVAQARATLQTAYGMIERRMAGRSWTMGEDFGIADCAAFPGMFFADMVEPFSAKYPNMAAYFERLLARPSIQRVLAEARPYFTNFPYYEAMPARFR